MKNKNKTEKCIDDFTQINNKLAGKYNFYK